MRYRFLSLLISILAGIVAVETFRDTLIYAMLSVIMPSWIFYGVLVAPLLGFVRERRVFGTGYYFILVILALIPSIQDSELFEGLIDAVYYLGYEMVSRSILDMFPYTDSFNSLFLITALHLAGIYSENIEVYERKLETEGYRFTLIPSLFLLTLTAGLIYTNLGRITSTTTEPDFVYTLISISLLSFSIIFIWRFKE